MRNPILNYEICEDKLHPGDWRVEYDNDSCEIAIFVGTRAEERAREYAAWKRHIGGNDSELSRDMDRAAW